MQENAMEENKQWKSIAMEMKTWIWLRELWGSTGISVDEKPAEVLIGIMAMHMHACLMCTCITHVCEAIMATKTGCQRCENSL